MYKISICFNVGFDIYFVVGWQSQGEGVQGVSVMGGSVEDYVVVDVRGWVLVVDVFGFVGCGRYLYI